MSTIYDVAKLAGVSTGTVSKFVNGTGYVSPSKREGIAAAIEALGYTPNHSARQLKLNKSADIAIVIPNMSDRIYRQVFNGAASVLQDNYRLIVHMTDDIVQRETNILRECVNSGCAGVILCTCQPGNTALFSKVRKALPVVFALRRPEREDEFNFLGFNDGETVFSITTELLKLGYADIALYAGDPEFSCERQSIDAFKRAFSAYDTNPCGAQILNQQIYDHQISKEATFRNIMHLLDKPHPRVFITTSFASAQAIREVAFFRTLELGRDIIIISLAEAGWYDSVFTDRIICTFRDARKLGMMCARTLCENILSPVIFENANVCLTDDFPCEKIEDYISQNLKNAAPRITAKYEKTLKMAFNVADSGTDAIKSLIPLYMKQEEVTIVFETMPHNELYSLAKRQAEQKSGEYDLISVDVPWLPYLDSKGLLLDLTGRFYNSEISKNILPETLEKVGVYGGKVLGIPIIHALSLLYYRKDLFADEQIADDFCKKYKAKLKPPTTWYEFNVIAKYFTRKHNPASPTLYGTSIFGGGFSAAFCSEIYPRMWAYGGRVFDKHGHVTLYSRENLRAFSSIAETIKYSNPQSLNFGANDNLTDFAQGNIAMAVAFSNNASVLVDSSRTKLWDRLGFEPIPSRTPVVPGWNLCINSHSRNADQAWNFISRLMSMELSVSYTILGGTSPIKSVFENAQLLHMYPWLTMSREYFQDGIARNVPALPGVPILEEMHISDILENIMKRHLSSGAPLNTLLLDAHKTLCAYAEQNSYPKNPPISLNML